MSLSIIITGTLQPNSKFVMAYTRKISEGGQCWDLAGNSALKIYFRKCTSCCDTLLNVPGCGLGSLAGSQNI